MSTEQSERRPGLLRQWGPLLLGVVTVAALILVFRRSEFFQQLDFSAIRWSYIVLIVLCELIAFALRGYMLALFVSHEGIRLSFLEWMGLSVVSNVTNLILPVSGGMVARAGYLKARYGYSIAHFSALFAASHLVIFLVSGFSGLLILGINALSGGSIHWLALILLALMGAAPIVILVLPVERLHIPAANRLLRWLETMREGWQRIRASRRLLVSQILVVTILQVVQAAALFFAFFALNHDLSFWRVLLLGVLLNLTNFVRITPGALGMREAVAGLAAKLVNVEAALGVSVAILDRLCMWLISFTLGPIFMVLLARRANQPVTTEPPQA